MPAPLLNYRYRVLKALGEGGFGKTYLAEDTQMPSRRRCVIKQLKPMSDRPDVFALVQERFAREAAVLESVGKGHSQIPDLYAYFEEGGLFYLVQEWIEGTPLIDLASNTWEEDRVQSLVTSALSALSHVHKQNIIHRDIKPDNIIVREADQLPCLIDFGAVKELMSTVMSSSGAQESSVVIGTPGFMAPEQAIGRPTFSSDLYSLAMTAIFLLTGRSPAQIATNSSTGELLWQQHAPTVSDRLASVLSKAVQTYPENRYPTAADMLAALPSPSNPPAHLTQQTPLQPTAAPANRSRKTVLSVGQSSEHPGHSSSDAATVAASGPAFVNASSASASTAGADVPWKRVGLAVGALVVAGSVLFGLRPQVTLESETAQAQLEDYQEEIEALEAKVEQNANDDASKLELAQAYLEVGNYEEAIAQVNVLNASIPEALQVKGQAQFETGNYQNAIDALTQAVEQQPSADIYNLRGDAYYETGQYNKAVEDYQNALRIDPKNGQAYVNWSAVNLIEGSSEEALQNLNLAVNADPKLISAYVNRGSRRAELGDRTGAKEDWRKASKLPASTASEYVSRGYAKSRLNQKSAATGDYNQALILNPNYARAFANKGAVFYDQNEKEQALKEFEKALAINPNYLLPLILKGEILAYQNNPDWQGAIAAYSKALDTNPNDPDVLNNRCGAYFAVGDLDKAEADCERGLSINPRSGSMYLARGNIRLQKENYNKAIQDYSRTIELAEAAGGDTRKEQPAYSNRASARMQIQDIEGALADINKAIELKSDAPEDYYKRGLIKVALDDREGGAEDLRKASDLYVQQGRTDSHQQVLAMMQQLGL